MPAKGHPIERVHPPKLLMKLVNPLMLALAKRRRGVQSLVLVLHYRGRKTGQRYDLPVGYRLVNGRIMLFTNSEWRHNFQGGRELEVTYLGQRQPATATLTEDPGIVADLYQKRFGDMDRRRAQRDLGVRVSQEQAPTHAEWLSFVKREGMSIVEVILGNGPT